MLTPVPLRIITIGFFPIPADGLRSAEGIVKLVRRFFLLLPQQLDNIFSDFLAVSRFSPSFFLPICAKDRALIFPYLRKQELKIKENKAILFSLPNLELALFLLLCCPKRERAYANNLKAAFESSAVIQAMNRDVYGYTTVPTHKSFTHIDHKGRRTSIPYATDYPAQRGCAIRGIGEKSTTNPGYWRVSEQLWKEFHSCAIDPQLPGRPSYIKIPRKFHGDSTLFTRPFHRTPYLHLLG